MLILQQTSSWDCSEPMLSACCYIGTVPGKWPLLKAPSLRTRLSPMCTALSWRGGRRGSNPLGWVNKWAKGNLLEEAPGNAIFTMDCCPWCSRRMSWRLAFRLTAGGSSSSVNTNQALVRTCWTNSVIKLRDIKGFGRERWVLTSLGYRSV